MLYVRGRLKEVSGCYSTAQQEGRPHDRLSPHDNALIWEHNHETVRIEPWGRDSLRVRATVGAKTLDDLPGALLAPAAAVVQIDGGEERAIIRNGALAAEVSSEGLVRFVSADTGAELLAEEPQHYVWPPARYFKPLPGDLFRIEARFKAYDDERFYGLGQHQHGKLDQKGCVIDLLHRNFLK